MSVPGPRMTGMIQTFPVALPGTPSRTLPGRRGDYAMTRRLSVGGRESLVVVQESAFKLLQPVNVRWGHGDQVCPESTPEEDLVSCTDDTRLAEGHLEQARTSGRVARVAPWSEGPRVRGSEGPRERRVARQRSAGRILPSCTRAPTGPLEAGMPGDEHPQGRYRFGLAPSSAGSARGAMAERPPSRRLLHAPTRTAGRVVPYDSRGELDVTRRQGGTEATGAWPPHASPRRAAPTLPEGSADHRGGGMGRALASMCAQGADGAGTRRWRVRAFIDEDRELHGTQVDGLPVHGGWRPSAAVRVRIWWSRSAMSAIRAHAVGSFRLWASRRTGTRRSSTAQQ
jgi:hypothetical protein